MKVLLISSENAPFSPVCGGALGTQHDLFRHFTEVDLTVVAPRSDSDYPNISYSHINSNTLRLVETTTSILPERFRFPPSRTYPYYAMLKTMAIPHDLVYVINRPLTPVVIRKFNKKSLIVLLMWNDHMDGLNDQLLGQAIASADAIIFISHYLRNGVLKRCPESIQHKLHVLPQGIDTVAFKAKEVLDPDLKNGVTLFFAGRLVPEKGLHLLLDAFAEVLKLHPSTRLLIAGSSWFGPSEETDYVKSLKKRALQMSASIHFLGPISYDQMPEAYKKADIMIVPSICNEAHGAVNVEAMATGTALVTSNRGGIKEYVDDAAIVVDPINVGDLTKAILSLIDSKTLRLDNIHKGLGRVNTMYAWPIVARQYESFFKTLLEEKNLIHAS